MRNPYVGRDIILGGPSVQNSNDVSAPLLYEQLMPFEQQNLALATPTDIVALPQRDIRSERLCIGSSYALNFTFSAFTIGQDNMFVNNGDVPCELFTEVAVGMSMRGYTAGLGTRVTMVVTNRTGAAGATFRAAVRGTSIVRAL